MSTPQLKVDSVVYMKPDELVFAAANRIVDMRHVSRLKASMQEENLLHVNPIKINPKREIIDGQHRVTAAMYLKLKAVPCLVVQANVHDAQRLNRNSKNWDLKDFAHYWAQQGKAEYQTFLDFVEQTGLVPSIAVEILGPTHSGRSNSNFRKGIWNIGKADHAYAFMDAIEMFKPYLHEYRRRAFVRAFWKMYNTLGKRYDQQRMLHKVSVVGLRRTVDMHNYLDQLQNAYNYHVKVKERVMFV